MCNSINTHSSPVYAVFTIIPVTAVGVFVLVYGARKIGVPRTCHPRPTRQKRYLTGHVIDTKPVEGTRVLKVALQLQRVYPTQDRKYHAQFVKPFTPDLLKLWSGDSIFVFRFPTLVSMLVLPDSSKLSSKPTLGLFMKKVLTKSYLNRISQDDGVNVERQFNLCVTQFSTGAESNA